MTDLLTHNKNTDLDERNIAATDLKAAEDKIQSLCVSHAATFVAVERRGATLTSSLTKLLQALDQACPKVEEAKECLEVDSGDSKEISPSDGGNNGNDAKRKEGNKNTLTALAEKHKMRRRTLLQHSSLLELLEMPNLMDACVRGHLYEEGLSIASFANTLESRHLGLSNNHNSGNEKIQDSEKYNPIVANVVKEIRKREIDLRRHLLHRLRSDVTMPQCLEVVTALRRLNGVELERLSRENASGINSVDLEKVHEAMEWRLQVNFLEARDVWLDGFTASSASKFGISSQTSRKLGKKMMSSGNSEQLLDNIDVYRTRCFEIATQFLAIFHSTTTAVSRKANASPSDKATQLLSMWTTRRIDTFLHQQLASKYLPMISDTATLRDALESSTFFATSMGRIGADFSPLLPTFFVPRLFVIVTSHWNDGLNAFQDTLKVCREAGIASILYNSREVLSPIGAKTGDEDTTGPGVGFKTPAPPRQLLSLPPLARLVNSFLNGLNELRRCLLASAFPQLRSHFKDSFLVKVRAILGENERVVLKPGFLNKGEDAGKLRTLAVEFKEEFNECVEPYLASALEVSLGVFDSMLQPKDDLKASKQDEGDFATVSQEELNEKEGGRMTDSSSKDKEEEGEDKEEKGKDLVEESEDLDFALEKEE